MLSDEICSRPFVRCGKPPNGHVHVRPFMEGLPGQAPEEHDSRCSEASQKLPRGVFDRTTGQPRPLIERLLATLSSAPQEVHALRKIGHCPKG